MIEVDVDGVFLDLPKDTKIRITLRSQVFDRSFIAQSYSYPIALPWTDVNAKAMRHYERIANAADLDDIPCTIRLGGFYWRGALIKYRGFKNGSYDIDLSIPPDAIITQLSELTLQDFDYGGPYDFSHFPDTDVAGFNQLFEDHTGTVADTPFIFAPIHNPGLFGDRTETYYNAEAGVSPWDIVNPPTGYINNYDPGTTYPWIIYGSDPAIEEWFNDYSPLPYLAYVVEHIFETLGYSVEGDVFANAEVRTMVIVSNLYFTLNVITTGGVLSFISNDGYQDISLKRAVPVMSCIEFLIALMQRFNAVPVFRQGQKMAFISVQSMLDDPAYVDITEHMVPDDLVIVETSGGVNLEESPESLDTQRADAVEFNPDRILGEVVLPADLAAYTPDVGDQAIVSVNNKVYQYQEDPVNGAQWAVLCDYLGPHEEFPSEATLSAGVALTSMLRTSEWLVPEMSQVVTDPFGNLHSIGLNDATKLRLLFYRGMQEDFNGDTYPLLSTYLYDWAGNNLGSMSETIEGKYGIYARWYADSVEWMRTSRTIKRRARLPLHIIRHFDFTRKYRILGINYMVRSLDVEVTGAEVGIAQLELVKV